MMRVVSQSNLARLGGVKVAVLWQLVVRGRLAAARVELGGRKNAVNVDHPLVIEWLADHGCNNVDDKYTKLVEPVPDIKRAKKNKYNEPKPKLKPKPEPKAEKVPRRETMTDGQRRYFNIEQTHIGGHSVEDLADLTVKEIVTRYGSVDGFKRFVDSLKTISDYNFRELRTQERRGELIERERVSGVLMQVIDVAFRRLVSDVPANISQQVLACVQTGGDDVIIQIEKIYRDANTLILQSTKEKLDEELAKYDGK